MSKFKIILFLAPLFLSFGAHKYYLSVTDVTHNPEAESLQIITRLFYDDLEAVLQERYDKSIVVDATADQEKLDRYLQKYMRAKLEVSINGFEQEQSFIGKEYEDDYVVVYIEIENVATIHDVSINNELLMDLFPDQKNMMHTEINGKKKSFLLIKGNAKAVLNFSE
ncbi:peptidase E [Dokdonia sinensis]|uniref:Peptidase E n=1 Tax=Dokdonia sinensis TaxID=2479847 RepID=A0A3M0FWL1_9FLAO|nr:DUF6702 family protein [Dokdonia sinensis]RMB56367.1 peptidase E [Dokdonia sinensis]